MSVTKTSKRDLAIIALARAYESKDEPLIQRVESALLPEAVVLPDALKAVLESWGTSPIEEPDMFLLIEGGTTDDVKELAVKDLNVDDFNALDISTLASQVIRRITDKRDSDGVFKTTPAIDGLKLPRTSGVRTLKEMVIAKVPDEDILKVMFEIVGISSDSLTQWEKDLVRDIVVGYVNASDSDLMGVFSDRTPFARYLKN